jgi:predicted nucleic acid-binding protein
VIVVDASAWIEYLRGTGSDVHLTLRRLVVDAVPLANTTVGIMEVLSGTRTEDERIDLREHLMAFPLLTIGGLAGYEQAAQLYRDCRRLGVTPRGLLDCLVASVAIRDNAQVLGHDRDFGQIARVTPLELYPLDQSG